MWNGFVLGLSVTHFMHSNNKIVKIVPGSLHDNQTIMVNISELYRTSKTSEDGNTVIYVLESPDHTYNYS